MYHKQHIDALVNRMLMTVNEEPELFKDKWTVMDHFGWVSHAT